MLRSCVRINHHKRISDQISATKWPAELSNQGITRNTLINLCQSHGESIGGINAPKGQNYDLRFCAVLLRLADSLDFDSSRAPSDLFKHLGLDSPENFEQMISQTEWAKNRAGIFGEIKDGVIPFMASFTSLQLEYEVQAYLDWTQRELEDSGECLTNYAGKWQSFVLPRKISTDCVERNGYRFGKFCLTMDQDRVLELLTGRNLYSDPGVFVRELLQNAIDAVLTRSRLDPYFEEKDGRIVIRSWIDNEGYSWFRIEDNGTGMNEHIITDYFLKVGRSYYVSDEFKADKRHYGRGRDYAPISRFGIGILSCFMSDPEQNLLEVSTKRYSQDLMSSNPAIRLNVTGLHGYYYLAQEQEQADGDEFFQPMHNPQNEREGYRSEVGTTICVRVNLYQLGNYRSFKEIVDKYVQFPSVHVEYIGPEGHTVYPTQSLLMEAVHGLNSDGPNEKPREYVHLISEDAFNNLKRKMPDTIWDETPAVVLQYYPLDWLSASENIKGAAIFAKLRASAISKSFWYQGSEFSPEFKCSLETKPSENKISLKFSNDFPSEIENKMHLLETHIEDGQRFYSEYEYRLYHEYFDYHDDPNWLNDICTRYHVSKKQVREKGEELRKLGKNNREIRRAVEQFNRLTEENRVDISYDELVLQLGATEKEAFCHIKKALCYIRPQLSEKGSNTLSAYNGILADTSNLFRKDNQCIGLVLLLQGDYCPEVNLARDTISKLPLEAACNLVLLQSVLPRRRYIYGEVSEILQSKQFALLSEQELQSLLDRHPEWEKYLSFNNKSLVEVRESVRLKEKTRVSNFDNGNLYGYLCLAALKQRFTVRADFSDGWKPYIVDDSAKENDTADFPIAMFYAPAQPTSLFGKVQSYSYTNYFNKEHFFSRWLIQHREELQRLVPGVYNGLLETLLLSRSSSEIIENVNSALMRLKEFKNNLFKVSEELFLKSNDLA